jgi:hypothetical protein
LFGVEDDKPDWYTPVVPARSIFAACLLLMPLGCDETSVHLIIHSKLVIPDEIDALCVQLAAAGELDFAKRYPLSAQERGRPLTLSVLPGERHDRGFEVLLRGERRGWEVSWVRQEATFEEHSVREKDIYLRRCGGREGQGLFTWGGQLTNASGSALAAAPVAYTTDEVVVVAPGDSRRFAFIQDGIKHVKGGLPAGPKGAVHGLLAVDVDNDCDLDLLVLGQEEPLLWIHDGNGAFAPRANAIQIQGEYLGAAAADINLDGFVDLVLVSPSGPRLLRNKGEWTGTFVDSSSWIPLGLDDATAVATGFINKDAYPDIVIARGQATGKRNVVLINQFSGPDQVSFAKVELTGENLTTSLAVADLDGDDLHDLVVGNANEDPIVHINTTDQVVSLEPRPLALPEIDGETAEMILARDLDDDCDIDLVAARAGGIRIFLNDGHGAFASSSGTSLPGATRVDVADVTGDQVLDLVLGGGDGAYYLSQER